MNVVGFLLEVQFYGAFWLWVLGLIPAAVVSVLKGRLLFFFVGFPTFGITWYVGALSLADPGSLWARRFYGERRAAGAGGPEPDPRSPRATAAWLLGSLVLLLAVGLFATRPAPLIGVDGRALQYSVGGSGILDSPPSSCTKEKGAWTCRRYDSSVSGYVPYRVEANGFGCWTATSGGWSGEESPKRLSGCITIWDEIRLMNAIF